MRVRSPRITLIGAGPGDPELMTLKGWKAMAMADVILYDRLIGKAMLHEAPADIPLIYVGKAPGEPCMSQEAINQLLIDSALQYGHAVRLKGGDPFIFGRGYEEVAAATWQGIPVTVIPGISSSTGLAAIHQIPLTARGTSESVWIISASTHHGTLSKEVIQAAKSDATVVILMGMQHLHEIVDCFTATGRARMPIAIIQQGSLPEEKVITGTISNICLQVQSQRIRNPAVIIIGKAVGLGEALRIARNCA